MPRIRIPNVTGCCYCITDLNAAAAIITVLAIVTNPVLSWAAVRHSYIIHVSCEYMRNNTRPDVVDISINNIVSFGFGANAGLEMSCLHAKNTETKILPDENQRRSENQNASTEVPSTEKQIMFLTEENEPIVKPKENGLLITIRILGWILMLVDSVLLIAACLVLYRIYLKPNIRVLKVFMITALISTIFSFLYGIFFVCVCVIVSRSFPILETIFILFNFGMWCYFILVLNSYRFACSHTIRIVLWPTCTDLHDKANGNMASTLVILKWILFIINLFLILSSFAFLIGMFMSYSITGDVYIGLGFTSAFFSIFYGISALVQVYNARCLFNANDTLALFIYGICWSYFILIVNSYLMTADDK